MALDYSARDSKRNKERSTEKEVGRTGESVRVVKALLTLTPRPVRD